MSTAPIEVPPMPRPRLPDWLRIRLPTTDTFASTRKLLEDLRLHTVCESAKCPNHWECWSQGTATFMIAGDRCTARAASLCRKHGQAIGPRSYDEPERVAAAVRRMRLKHVVITAVARDDLRGWRSGSFQAHNRIGPIHRPGNCHRSARPGFNNRDAAIQMVLSANPAVFNHNLETVRRLTPKCDPEPLTIVPWLCWRK